jgi:hypothetical protein
MDVHRKLRGFDDEADAAFGALNASEDQSTKRAE